MMTATDEDLEGALNRILLMTEHQPAGRPWIVVVDLPEPTDWQQEPRAAYGPFEGPGIAAGSLIRKVMDTRGSFQFVDLYPPPPVQP